MTRENSLVLFQGSQIRRAWHKGDWWYCIEDVVFVLTNSRNTKGYVKDLRRRDKPLSKGWGQIATPLSLDTPGGKQKINCAHTKGIFRIIQSIPSKKAEPFKQWLAKVGYERVQEIENPELAQDRAKEYYEMKGYPPDWIDKRMRSIAVRQALTDEWKNRGITKDNEYAILTNEIAKATFGLEVQDHKMVKNLDPKRKNQNLRDHMTHLELIFNMLGEASTTEIAQTKDSQGFGENRISAKKGGKIAGDARESLEKETGRKVVSRKNYLGLQKRKLLS